MLAKLRVFPEMTKKAAPNGAAFGYPQEKGEEEPMYMLIPIDEWFVCKDFVSKLANPEPKEWFKKDIGFWEKEIEDEFLRNAHERAIYD